MQKSIFKRERTESYGRGKRTISTKHPMHFVFKADRNIVRHRKIVDATLTKMAKRFGITVYRTGHAKDHLHLVARIKNRYTYPGFVRALAGLLAKRLKIKWIKKPFSRIAHWGRDYQRLSLYAHLNEQEGRGAPYRPQRTRGLSPPREVIA